MSRDNNRKVQYLAGICGKLFLAGSIKQMADPVF